MNIFPIAAVEVCVGDALIVCAYRLYLLPCGRDALNLDQYILEYNHNLTGLMCALCVSVL